MKIKKIGYLILIEINFLLVYIVDMYRKDLIGIFVDLEFRLVSYDDNNDSTSSNIAMYHYINNMIFLIKVIKQSR